MDLAQSLGCTVDELSRRMTVAEFNLWLRYSAYKGLPWRRVELQLAQISLMVGRGLGALPAETALGDLLIDPPPPGDATEPEDEDEYGDDAFSDVPLVVGG